MIEDADIRRIVSGPMDRDKAKEAWLYGLHYPEYLTGTILSMLECDVDETVPNNLKRFSREVVEVLQI